MKEYFLVINPIAAGHRVERIWPEKVQPLIEDYNIEYDFEFTQYPRHATDIAKKRVNEGYRIICAIGGDGTSNEVINGILKSDKNKEGVFAAIPLGTGDDIPTAFGIPEGNLEAAVRCLAKGLDKKFDVGYCENANRYFAGVASMGFDAEVADRTNKGSKRLSGTQNYQLALLKTIFKFKPYEVIIKVDNELTIEGKKMLIAIGNGKRYGAGMHICPSAEVTDGKFTATTVNKISRFTLLRIFPKVYNGEHVKHPKVEIFEGKSVSVDSPKKKCLYQVDGEILGDLPETFITKSNYLTVRVPDPWLSYSQIWQEKLYQKSKKNPKER
jgi:diacylglycerol kinase (ATP)